jgi:hypothetical protein
VVVSGERQVGDEGGDTGETGIKLPVGGSSIKIDPSDWGDRSYDEIRLTVSQLNDLFDRTLCDDTRSNVQGKIVAGYQELKKLFGIGDLDPNFDTRARHPGLILGIFVDSTHIEFATEFDGRPHSRKGGRGHPTFGGCEKPRLCPQGGYFHRLSP